MVSLVASVRDASAEGGRGPELDLAAPLDPATSERAPVVWKRTWVDERPAMYGVAGEGLPVVILHGWGLAHHAYKGAIERLVAQGTLHDVHSWIVGRGLAGREGASLPDEHARSLAVIERRVDGRLQGGAGLGEAAADRHAEPALELEPVRDL